MSVMSSIIISVAAFLSASMNSVVDDRNTIQDFKDKMYSNSVDSWEGDYFNFLPVTDDEFSLTFLE